MFVTIFELTMSAIACTGCCQQMKNVGDQLENICDDVWYNFQVNFNQCTRHCLNIKINIACLL